MNARLLAERAQKLALLCDEDKDDSPRNLILARCLDTAEMLFDKNARYGNSALEPLRVFSRATPIAQLEDRIDDKLSRLARGEGVDDAGRRDAVRDLIGYLILYRIAQGWEG